MKQKVFFGENAVLWGLIGSVLSSGTLACWKVALAVSV